MISKNKQTWIFLLALLPLFLLQCGVYSFTGAAIEGKTINIHFIENQARNIVPSLSASFTEKLRQRILSQTSLSQVNAESTDYDISGHITNYDVTVASIAGNETSSTNRLTISVLIEYKNKLNPKSNFQQSFSRFADFSATKNLQSVENQLIADISDQIVDDIFNKAFVNW